MYTKSATFKFIVHNSNVGKIFIYQIDYFTKSYSNIVFYLIQEIIEKTKYSLDNIKYVIIKQYLVIIIVSIAYL